MFFFWGGRGCAGLWMCYADCIRLNPTEPWVSLFLKYSCLRRLLVLLPDFLNFFRSGAISPRIAHIVSCLSDCWTRCDCTHLRTTQSNFRENNLVINVQKGRKIYFVHVANSVNVDVELLYAIVSSNSLPSLMQFREYVVFLCLQSSCGSQGVLGKRKQAHGKNIVVYASM